VGNGDGAGVGLCPADLSGVLGGSMDGRGGVQGDVNMEVGFGRVRFDPFCDETREVLGGSVIPLGGVDMWGG
jgi:hypothetical protein